MNTNDSPPETRRVICNVCNQSFVIKLESGIQWCKNGCTKISLYITEYWPVKLEWDYLSNKPPDLEQGGDNG